MYQELVMSSLKTATRKASPDSRLIPGRSGTFTKGFTIKPSNTRVNPGDKVEKLPDGRRGIFVSMH